MKKKIYTIETIKEHQDEAAELFSFGEAKEILQSDGELTEKLALAFTLGYMKAKELKEA